MTPQEAVKILKAYNRWRRGDVEKYHNTPSEIGIAIDVAIKELEK